MERSTIVRVHEGLHARPATRFVKLAKSFQSEVEIVKESKAASAKSSVKLMLLAVKENDTVTLRAAGVDESEALDALIDFLENPESGLGDGATAAPGTPASQNSTKTEMSSLVMAGLVQGIAGSEGVGLAKVFHYFPKKLKPTYQRLQDHEIAPEIARFQQAVSSVQHSMETALAGDGLSETDSSIISALSEIAGDPAIIDGVVAEIGAGVNATDALLKVTDEMTSAFGKVADVYLNARADDVRAIARQICLALAGEQDIGLDQITEPSILLAEDIGAWDLARAPLKLIKGVICAHGGATSHIAIIARAHGIPAVLGLGGKIDGLLSVDEVALDGGQGHIFPNPDAATRADFARKIEEAADEELQLRAFKNVRPCLADGTLIEVAANIGSIEEIDAAKDAGAMGIGLFRTELLFMKHGGLPTEDMQFEIYSQAAAAFAPSPVIIRTLDIGGDKPISGVVFPEEQNPFLGWRGVRMCLDRSDIFKPQLRALLRAAVNGNLKVMLPMVSIIDEVARTRAIIEECKHELTSEGLPFQSFDLGVMIETPAAVMIAPDLARQVDFFSIGTNDLTQYIMAADRMNPQVAPLNDVANPAVLAAIEMAAQAGAAAGIMVGMCGEAAARPDLIPLFLKFGLTEFSMSPASIPRAKKRIVELNPAG